ncbi:MAG: branched chain amino acid aminotransferase, partial [Clostridia bacterium]|nr:branched chain amino acid aminotransferase [Clostridia bacterium]
MLDIKFEKANVLKEKPDPNTLGFGEVFTDYMFMMDYSKNEGWHDAKIVPYGELSLSPAACVFHYGAEVFEGMKAYRTPDGDVQLFRPMENIRRLNNSAERLCLPQIDEELALHVLTKFVEVEKDWVPSKKGTSLYLRPFLIATDAKLGLHAIDEAKYVIIASPVGSYYKEGINPVK